MALDIRFQRSNSADTSQIRQLIIGNCSDFGPMRRVLATFVTPQIFILTSHLLFHDWLQSSYLLLLLVQHL